MCVGLLLIFSLSVSRFHRICYFHSYIFRFQITNHRTNRNYRSRERKKINKQLFLTIFFFKINRKKKHINKDNFPLLFIFKRNNKLSVFSFYHNIVNCYLKWLLLMSSSFASFLLLDYSMFRI